MPDIIAVQHARQSHLRTGHAALEIQLGQFKQIAPTHIECDIATFALKTKTARRLRAHRDVPLSANGKIIRRIKRQRNRQPRQPTVGHEIADVALAVDALPLNRQTVDIQLRFLHARDQIAEFEFFIFVGDLRGLRQLNIRLSHIVQLMNLSAPTIIGDAARTGGLPVQNPLHRGMILRSLTHQNIAGKTTIELMRRLRAAHRGVQLTQIHRSDRVAVQIDIGVQRPVVTAFPLTFEINRLNFIVKKYQIRALCIQATARFGQRAGQVARGIQTSGKAKLQLRQVRRAHVQLQAIIVFTQRPFGLKQIIAHGHVNVARLNAIGCLKRKIELTLGIGIRPATRCQFTFHVQLEIRFHFAAHIKRTGQLTARKIAQIAQIELLNVQFALKRHQLLGLLNLPDQTQFRLA